MDGAQGADSVQVPIGPVTRNRAKCFKEGLNGLIREAWSDEGTSLKTLELESKLMNMIEV